MVPNGSRAPAGMLIKRSAGALICLLALADAAVSPGSITPSRVFPPAFSPRSPILDHVDGVELSSELGNAVVSRQGQLQLLLRGGNDEEEPAEEPAWGAWLHDAEEGSLTLAWAAVPEASVYEVQLRKEGADEWTSLSAKITGTMLKKKNLDPSSRYEVRVRSSRENNQWSDFSEVISCETLAADAQRMQAPQIMAEDGDSCILKWEAVPGAESYEIQVRHQVKAAGGGGASQWAPLSKSVSGTSVRKRNLAKEKAYHFRVTPLGVVPTEEESSPVAWAPSPPSRAAGTAGLADSIRMLLGGSSTPLRDPLGGTVSVDSLAGKVVGVYCSASWCPPCKQYTPRLAHYYKQMKEAGRPFEIVFVSADRDVASFEKYHGSMPWLALPFGQAGVGHTASQSTIATKKERYHGTMSWLALPLGQAGVGHTTSQVREQALAKLGVQGIPMLTVYHPSGKRLHLNAVPVQLTLPNMDLWLAGTSADENPLPPTECM